MLIKAPQNVQELLERCQQIQGKSIGFISSELALEPPANLLHTKGWLGQLLENYLGATATSKALPDFPNLRIELKTIPINHTLKPLESTYVCTVQTNAIAANWRDSWVYQKLAQVLWIPVIGDKNSLIYSRIIGKPILWQMDAATESILQQDWEELMELLTTGHAKQISAKFGTYLHIRPKAASSKILIPYVDHDGRNTKMVPKGFYLRPAFTSMILKNTTQDLALTTR